MGGGALALDLQTEPRHMRQSFHILLGDPKIIKQFYHRKTFKFYEIEKINDLIPSQEAPGLEKARPSSGLILSKRALFLFYFLFYFFLFLFYFIF